MVFMVQGILSKPYHSPEPLIEKLIPY